MSSGSITNYGYDAINRPNALTQDITGTANDVTFGFGYNPANQITMRSMSNDAFVYTGDVNVSRNYAVNGLNQYTSAGPATFTYDANGNLTGDGSSTYVYDVENRLISASGATTATLRYDPLGRLYETSGGAAGITRFVYDGDELVAEYNNSGTMLRRYVHGSSNDDPMAWFEGPGVDTNVAKLIKTNHQGSVIALTDWNGNLTNINRYDEWGIPASTNIGRFQYTGQAWIPELRMYHYKARIYSPTLGRFLQTDPIGYDDQVNLYAYVANDPVNNTDPTGNDTCPDGSREICVTGTKTSPPPSTPPPPSGHTKLGVINRPGGDASKPEQAENENNPCGTSPNDTLNVMRDGLDWLSLGADGLSIAATATGVGAPIGGLVKGAQVALEVGLGGINAYDAYVNGNYAPGAAQIAGLGTKLLPGGALASKAARSFRGGQARNASGQFRRSKLDSAAGREAVDAGSERAAAGATEEMICIIK